MEFHEKLQNLRKQKGLTQEQLADILYVSRAAVSKWESGRGYPNLDSLKAIASFYSMSIDQLLSGDEILTIAKEEQNEHTQHLQDLVFGLLDLSAVLYFFLPLFVQQTDGSFQAVSLLKLAEDASWLNTIYALFAAAMILCGVLTLALQNCRYSFWISNNARISLSIHTAGTVLFILSTKPYAAAFSFLFLAIKVLILYKKQ